MLRALLEEITSALEARLYRVALLTSLAVPDIAGALDAPDGQATERRYVDWVDKWAVPHFSKAGFQTISGEDCYRYRCALIHQGRGKHPRSRYVATLFVLPSPGSFIAPMTPQVDGGRMIVIDVPTFCRWMVAAAEDWLTQVEGSELFATNSQQMLRLHKLEVRMS